MKKIVKRSRNDDGDMLPEYDFSKGVRGKHHAKFQEGVSVTVYTPNKTIVQRFIKKQNGLVRLAPDVAKVFGDAKSVNDTLRRVIASSSKKKRTQV